MMVTLRVLVGTLVGCTKPVWHCTKGNTDSRDNPKATADSGLKVMGRHALRCKLN